MRPRDELLEVGARAVLEARLVGVVAGDRVTGGERAAAPLQIAPPLPGALPRHIPFLSLQFLRRDCPLGGGLRVPVGGPPAPGARTPPQPPGDLAERTAR